MQTHPSTSELLEAVKHFVDNTAAKDLAGLGKFHARVASNVLAIVLRELDQSEDANAREAKGLATLLKANADDTPATLNRRLCEEIAAGAIGLNTPGLLAHLKTTAIAQLNIDQPHYSGLKTALEVSE